MIDTRPIEVDLPGLLGRMIDDTVISFAEAIAGQDGERHSSLGARRSGSGTLARETCSLDPQS
jgi:hypothetical protein